MISRRQFIKASAALAAGLMFPAQRHYYRRARAQGDPVSPTLTPYLDPLPIPSVLKPKGKLNGATYYEVPIQEVQQWVHSEMPGPTTFWGYNGSYPGPTIVARKNQPVAVKWINDLPAQYTTTHYLGVDTNLHGPDHFGTGARTTVHLHGGHVAPEADGYPEDTFLPGESATYFYPNRQDADTLWYHDHALGITRLNVVMGMAGFWLLRDGLEDKLKLPSGKYEIGLAFQDRTFNSDGSLYYPFPWQEEFFGDVIVVNGKAWPYLEVEPRKYRFRFLGGSNARSFGLYTDPAMTFYQIGCDGGLLQKTVNLNHILLAPGERADVIMDFSDFSPGEVIELKNDADVPFGLGGPDTIIPEVMQFRVIEGALPDQSVIPTVLRPRRRLKEADAVKIRDFALDVIDDENTEIRLVVKSLSEGWMQDVDNWENYVVGSLWEDITDVATLGTSEVWRFWNLSPDMHPVHLHLVNFNLLDRQDLTPDESRPDFFLPQIAPGAPVKGPDANEMDEKDTVKMYAGQVTRIIMKWGSFPGLYPFHCHIIDHEDHEMMRQVRVIQEPEI